LSDVVSECRKNNDLEFEANQRVLKAFKATEHITKKHISDMPSSPSEEGN